MWSEIQSHSTYFYYKKMKREKLIYGCILAGIFLLSLYIRGILPFLSSGISISGNDPWYNLRLVENTLYNFPHRIYFDAYTHLPYGTEVPFAPLFDYLIAIVIWTIGLGDPYATLGDEGIRMVFAWIPPILGVIVIIPVYLIGKTLWNRNAGLIAAVLIAVLPGQFLLRSLLGFTDHHVLEVLLSTAAMLMFILVIKTAKDHNLQLKTLRERDWITLKKPLFLSILTGVVFGAFYLSWRGAPMFLFVLLIFCFVQFISDHLRNENTEYLSIAVVPAFVVSLLIVSPFLLIPYAGFADFQSLSLVVGIIVFFSLTILSTYFKHKNLNAVAYPFVVLSIGAIFLIILNIFIPSLYHLLITGNLSVFFPSGGALTIQEVNPMGIPQIWSWFSTTFFVMFIGVWFVANNIRKHKRPEEVLFLIWCLVMLFACFGQNRFAYYYAVNVALLCGLASWKLIELVSYKKETKKVKGKSRKSKTKQIKTLNKAHAVIVCSLIFLVVIFPSMSTSLKVAPGSIPNDWYDALTWMRNNTPDPGVDYYGIYEVPPEGENYNYPESAYSVMSWWDYGHWITTIAHRIPFANPFQAGAHTAAEYLISTDEIEANKILDELDSKYVILDYPICDFLGTPTNPNPKYVMPVWTGKNPNPLQTVMVRLLYFDGLEVVSENIPALQHYRLIYESSTFVLPYSVIDTKTNKIIGWQAYHGAYEPIKSDLHKLHEGAMIQGQDNLMAKTPVFFHPFAFVKIFEYVDGYKITGFAENGSVVIATTNVTTNQGRKFTYTQKTLSDSEYEFVVPYEGDYVIRVGQLVNQTVVWEEEKIIKIN